VIKALLTCTASAGTTTTCESLFMGVPCVTLAGRCHAHNVGVSLLSTVGIESEWVGHDREDYIRIATAWAAKPKELAALRQRLRGLVLASPLCDAAPFLRGLESRYRECFERWRRAAGGGESLRSSASGEALWMEAGSEDGATEDKEGGLLVAVDEVTA
jgi:hypothetical protein